ncbi:MAG: ABC-2 transporter permease [Syntrophomonas sp.]
MYKLIRKDVLIQKPSLRWAMGYLLFILVIFSLTPDFADFAYIMAGFGGAYILVIGSFQLELKNQTDIFLNSLPTTRREIIVSRYLSGLLLTLFIICMTGALGVLMKLLPLFETMRFMNGNDILVVLLIAVLLMAIVLPTNLKFGPQGARVISMIVFLLLFFAPAWFRDLIVANRQAEWAQSLINLAVSQPAVLLAAMSGLGILLLALSLFVSLRLYETKDF